MKLIYKEIILVLSIMTGIMLLVFLPVKWADKANLVKQNSTKVTDKDTILICKTGAWTEAVSGFEWEIIGKNNIVFNTDENETEVIRVEGNLPTYVLNRSLYRNEALYNDNIFIFKGKFDGKYNDDGNIIRKFHVKKWDIVYPIKREDYTIPLFFSPNYISPLDCIKLVIIIAILVIIITLIVKKYKKIHKKS